MAQYVPAPMEWSDRALTIRAFIFDFWAEERAAPTCARCTKAPGSTAATSSRPTKSSRRAS